MPISKPGKPNLFTYWLGYRSGNWPSLLQSVQTDTEAHPVTNSINVREFTEVKQPRREAAHPPPTNAEVKNECSYLSTPRHPFKTCRGTNLPTLISLFCKITAGKHFYAAEITIEIKFVVPCIVILGWRNPTRCNSMQIFIYC